MIAYHNDAHLKDLFVKVLTWHQEQDRIIQKAYWENQDDAIECRINGLQFISTGAGCAVGCSIESLSHILNRPDVDHDDHSAYESLIGVPRVLARLEDGIFEGLPIERAREWPIQFAEAIPVGADLSLVWPRFAVWLLGSPEHGVIRLARTDKQRSAIQDVADAYQRLIEGQPPTIQEWRSYSNAAAAAYAYAAYAAAAYAAAYAAADAAADAAYYAAYYADADAADAADAAAAYAAAAYAAAAAKQQARIRQADYLLGLLRQAGQEIAK